MDLLGPFTLCSGDGTVIKIPGLKTRAVLALLAVSPQGERGRKWLQYKLWSDRGQAEGAASLRQSLRDLRARLDGYGVITASRQAITLDLDKITVDVRQIESAGLDTTLGPTGTFLEDLEIPDREFKSWLREQRSYWAEQIEKADAPALAAVSAIAPQPAQPIPADYTPIIALKPLSFRGRGKPSPYLWEGLSEAILEQLSRQHSLSIISRNSSQEANQRTQTIEEFGQAVDADYVVTGSLEGGEDAYLLRLELLRCPEQTIVWSGNFPINLPEGTDVLVQVASEIAGNLGAQVSVFHERQTPVINPSNPQTAHLVWRGRWHLNRLTKHDSAEAQKLFEQAIALDERSVDAHVHLAWSLLWQSWASRSARDDILKGRAVAQRAIRLDNTDGRAYWIVGTANCWLLDHKSAYQFTARAIELCPSLAIAHAQQGSNCILSGKPEEALKHLQRALILSPHDQQKFYFLGELAMAAYLIGNYDEALAFADEALMLRPAYWYAHLVRFLSNTGQGMAGAAERSLTALRDSRSGLNETDIEWLPFEDRGVNADMLEKLRAAGAFVGNPKRAKATGTSL
ncbi:tetratricopeptide repeat protein [Sulfitobacter sp. HNIBRBA2951]|uniref:tetratricopeptide repeat protein n=1 Tax=Sulfitobacter aquimarinus TaxID=3158557 RepID=UPI0032DE8F96